MTPTASWILPARPAAQPSNGAQPKNSCGLEPALAAQEKSSSQIPMGGKSSQWSIAHNESSRITLAARMIILVREIGGRELIPTPTVTLGIPPMLRGVKEVAGAAQPFKLEQERALPSERPTFHGWLSIRPAKHATGVGRRFASGPASSQALSPSNRHPPRSPTARHDIEHPVPSEIRQSALLLPISGNGDTNSADSRRPNPDRPTHQHPRTGR